jgi:hypothetical protein
MIEKNVGHLLKITIAISPTKAKTNLACNLISNSRSDCSNLFFKLPGLGFLAYILILALDGI